MMKKEEEGIDREKNTQMYFMIDAWEYEMCPERKCSLWLFTDPTWQYFMNIASLEVFIKMTEIIWWAQISADIIIA